MPRLTNKDYLRFHRFLKQVWKDTPSAFSVLSPTQQQNLHRYYQPSKNLTNAELLVHRQQISKQSPSLPFNAGKAFRRIDRAWAIAKKESRGDQRQFHKILSEFFYQQTFKTRGGYELQIGALMRAEPDYEKLAKALLRDLEERGLEDGGVSKQTLNA
jgi:hypothetical protein